MASLKESHVPDMYNCSVCMEHLNNRNPRFLICHHYFCEQCLKQLVRNNRISCPTCRKVTEVPHNDVTSLQVNYLLIQMLERELQLGPKKATTCMLCNIGDAECKCKECSQLFCGGCRGKHDRLQKFKGHVIQQLCDKHADGISNVCMKCHKEICDKCIIMEHGDHESEVFNHEEGIKKIKDKITKINRALKAKIDGMAGETENISTQDKQARKEIDQLNREIESLRMQIQGKMNKIQALDNNAKLFKEKVSAMEEEQKKYISLFDFTASVMKSEGGRLLQDFHVINQKIDKLKLDTSITEKRTCGLKLFCFTMCATCNIRVCKDCWKLCHSGHNSPGFSFGDISCECGGEGAPNCKVVK